MAIFSGFWGGFVAGIFVMMVLFQIFIWYVAVKTGKPAEQDIENLRKAKECLSDIKKLMNDIEGGNDGKNEN